MGFYDRMGFYMKILVDDDDDNDDDVGNDDDDDGADPGTVEHSTMGMTSPGGMG